MVRAKIDIYSGPNRDRHPIKAGNEYMVIDQQSDGYIVKYLLALPNGKSFGWTDSRNYDIVKK